MCFGYLSFRCLAAASRAVTAAAATDKNNYDNEPAASTVITASKHIFIPFSAHNCESATLCGE